MSSVFTYISQLKTELLEVEICYMYVLFFSVMGRSGQIRIGHISVYGVKPLLNDHIIKDIFV